MTTEVETKPEAEGQPEAEKKPAVTERRPWMAWPEEMQAILDRRMRRFGLRPFREWLHGGEWLMDIDMFRKDDTLVIRADVPGIKPEDIEVTVDGDLLTIKGHREEEKEVEDEDYYCSERSSGSFVRTVRLPEGVTADQVDAHRDNGVLEVTIPLPKAAEPKAVKVTVK